MSNQDDLKKMKVAKWIKRMKAPVPCHEFNPIVEHDGFRDTCDSCFWPMIRHLEFISDEAKHRGE